MTGSCRALTCWRRSMNGPTRSHARLTQIARSHFRKRLIGAQPYLAKYPTVSRCHSSRAMNSWTPCCPATKFGLCDLFRCRHPRQPVHRQPLQRRHRWNWGTSNISTCQEFRRCAALGPKTKGLRTQSTATSTRSTSVFSLMVESDLVACTSDLLARRSSSGSR